MSPRIARLNLGINTHRPSIDNLYRTIFNEQQLCQLLVPHQHFLFSAFSSSASILLQQLIPRTEIHLTTSFEIHSLKSALFPRAETANAVTRNPRLVNIKNYSPHGRHRKRYSGRRESVVEMRYPVKCAEPIRSTQDLRNKEATKITTHHRR